MDFTHSILMRRSYFILGSFSLLMVTVLLQDFLDLVPEDFEWFFSSLLLLALSAWVGMVGLIGGVAPVGRGAAKYVYAPLAVFPLAMLGVMMMTLINTLWNYLFKVDPIIKTARGLN